MALRYLRVLGDLTPEQIEAAGNADAGIAAAGESGCIVLPPGYALGELGGAEVANLPPSPHPKWHDIAALCLASLIAGLWLGWAFL